MKQKKLNLVVPILSILFLSVLGIGGIFIWSQNEEEPPRPGLVKVKEYRYYGPDFDGPVCQALTPECGVCPGEVIDKMCWIESDL